MNGEYAAAGGGVSCGDSAIVLFNNIFAYRQPQAQPGTSAFGCKERLKYNLGVLRSKADAKKQHFRGQRR